MNRILSFRKGSPLKVPPSGGVLPPNVLDGAIADAIDGPIDCDKFDYLVRDSIACGVPYGQGIDSLRFLRALTVHAVKHASTGVHLCLGYQAKGRAAIQSLLLARLQLYEAIYWHHTFRCIKAMFAHAAHKTFKGVPPGTLNRAGAILDKEAICEVFFQRVIMGRSWNDSAAAIRGRKGIKVGNTFTGHAPEDIASEAAIDFIYKFADAQMQDMLSRLVARRLYFRERSHSSYHFRFLHMIACMLLDGTNAPTKGDARRHHIVTMHGRSFASDVAMDYPYEVFEYHKIVSADDLIERLDRLKPSYSRRTFAPELDGDFPQSVNCVVNSPAPFSDRVASVFEHPALRRLKRQLQLGWIREVFPGASHERWSHSIGAYSAMIRYLNHLLADSAVPTFRIIAQPTDISHALVAAMLHDLGQTTFGHDFEDACPTLFQHQDIVERLLSEEWPNTPSLRELLKHAWPEVRIDRVLRILGSSAQFVPGFMQS